MRHQSPVTLISSESSSRRYLNGAYQPQITREQRATSVTSVGKLIKVTVHTHTASSSMKSVIHRPVERRTVQLFEKPIEYVERIEKSCHDSSSGFVVSRDEESSRQMIQDLHCQVESWKLNYANLQGEYLSRPDRTQEIDSYKQLLTENCDAFQMEIRSLKLELVQQKNMFRQVEGELSMQLERQRQHIEDRDTKLVLVSTEVERMNCQVAQKTEQLRIETQGLALLETQIRVRDDILEERNKEIGQLRRQVFKLADLEKVILMCKIENERLYLLSDQHENQMRDQMLLVSKYECTVSTLKVEVQRLSMQAQQKHDELSTMVMDSRQSQCVMKEREYDLEFRVELTNQQCKEYEITLADKNELLRIQRDEQSLLKTRVSELLQQIQFYQVDVDELIAIKQALQEQLNTRNRDFTSDCEAMMVSLRGELVMVSEECAHKLSNEVDMMNQKLKLKQRELEATQFAVSELKEHLQSQTVELSRLSHYELECHKLEEQCTLMCGEVDRLMLTIQAKDAKLNGTQSMIRELESSMDGMERQHHRDLLEEQKCTSESNIRCCELEGLLSLKQQDCEQLASEHDYERKKNITLVEEFRAQLQGVLSEKREQHHQLQSMRESIYVLEGSVDTTEIEKQRLTHALQESNSRINGLLHTVRQLEDECTLMVFERERVGQVSHDTIAMHVEKINHLTHSTQVKDDSIQQLQLNYHALQEEFLRLSDELRQQDLVAQEQHESYEHQMFESSESQTYLVSELDSWKQKFIVLNREFHHNQEELMMCQAEFDAYKQRQSVKVIQEVVQRQEFTSTTLEIKRSMVSSVSSSVMDKENQKKPLTQIN